MARRICCYPSTLDVSETGLISLSYQACNQTNTITAQIPDWVVGGGIPVVETFASGALQALDTIVFTIPFSGGLGTEPVIGDAATGAPSGSAGLVTAITTTAGDWALGTAEGTVEIEGTGLFTAADTLTFPAATADADSVTYVPESVNDGAFIAVLGWHAVDDGGGGFVRYDASSTAAVDNGLTFDGLGGTTPVPGASTSTGTGRFTRVLEGNAGLDVKLFGAAGDGVADDTAAMQAAIAEAVTNSQTLIFSAGSYLCAAGTCYTMTSGILRIKGSDATITGAGTAVTNIFLHQTGGSINVDGVAFSNWGYVTLSANTATASHSLEARNCSVSGCIAGFSSEIGDYQCERFVVVNCKFDDLETSAVRQVAATTYALVTGNTVSNVTSSGMYGSSVIQLGSNEQTSESGTSIVSDNLITDVSTGSAGAYGILTYGQRSHISNNTVSSVTSTDMSVCYGIYTKADYCVISGNTLKDAGGSDGMIVSKSTVGCLVTSNSLQFTATDRSWRGIRVNAERSLVANNSLECAAGVYGSSWIMGDSPNRLIVEHNILSGCVNSSNTGYGILASAATQVSIVGNLLYGCGASGVHDAQLIRVSGGSAATDVSIRGNRIIDTTIGTGTSYGVYILPGSSGWKRCVIANNEITSTMVGVNAATLSTNAVSDLVVTGNVISSLSIASGALSAYGIWLQSPDSAVVANNTIFDLATAGTGGIYAIYVLGSSSAATADLQIANNRIYDLTTASASNRAIYVNTNSGTFTGQTVICGNVASRVKYGISLSDVASLTELVVQGNHVFDAATDAFHRVGTVGAAVTYTDNYTDNILDADNILKITASANSATPSVAYVPHGGLLVSANSSGTTVTNFLGGVSGKSFTYLINDTNTTIDFTGTTLKGNGGADWTPTTGDHMTCVYDGTNWYCDVSSTQPLPSLSTVPTTDATVTTLATLATSSDRVYHVRAIVFATETADHNEVASYELVGTFQNDGGTLTQVGSTSYVHFSETTNGWDCVFSVSSPNVLVRVTGAVATLVNWKCKLTWEELT